MAGALDAGASLNLFPEVTRNPGHVEPMPFFRIALARPKVPLVPVWIYNLNRVLPKAGSIGSPEVPILKSGAS